MIHFNLIMILDHDVGDVRTRFLDMPVVNVGTARSFFDALKHSLSEKGLDFEKCIAFMFHTNNIMKGTRSGVQKLIKRECPKLYGVGCICHLADLTIKAGMKTLPVDNDQFFVDVFYFFFFIVANENKNLLITGVLSLLLSQKES